MLVRSLFSTARLMALVGALALNACASTGVSQRSAQAISSDSCATLSSMTISAEDIALPTRGARVTAAALVAASDQGVPAHCLVSAQIAPIDANAPNIEFRVASPLTWNGKIVMYGGGGLDGFIPDITGNQPVARLAMSPLARGYAVFGSDGGHQGPGPAFAQNRESYLNYLGEALKKTHDASLLIITRAYGRAPARSYFLGNSRGGAEGITVAARWPDDWDGIVSLFPARAGESALMMFGMLYREQVLAAPGAWLSPEKRELLFNAALERCDGLDGGADGVISNIEGCRAVFDPANATLRGNPLRCAGGVDAGPTCLSDAQIRALRLIDQPVRSGFPEATGDTTFPGYNILTSDSGRPSAYQVANAPATFGLGEVAPGTPFRPGMALSTWFAHAYTQVFLGLGPDFDPYSFDITNPPRDIAERYTQLARLDTHDTDLTAFARRGGRLILAHGTDDMLLSARWTQRYYEMARAQLGARQAQRSLRYYEIPGYSHGDGHVFNASWDMLSAIERWVEEDIDPAEREIVADLTGVPGRTRPLCLYPRFARYTGSGDLNAAASFVCSDH